MATSIAILVPFFGDWPPWIDFFVESCRANRSIDWFIFNDCDPPANRARNVRHQRTTFAEYKAFISRALNIRFDPQDPYKLCDVRPALPLVHRDLVGRYEFVGFGDLDVIYGDLRPFWDEQALGMYDLLSSHADRLSGHLCLMRNSEAMITAFQRAPKWRRVLEQADNTGFDETALFRLFRRRASPLAGLLGGKQARCLFREAYSTPAPVERMRWFWRDGRLTNEFYPHHQLMYLHFMSWHSNRWYGEQPGVSPDTTAPWSLLPQLVQMDWRDARKQGFMISPQGIQPLGRLPAI